MRSIGIDIGTFSIKVSVAEFTKKGLFLQSFKEHVLTATNPFDRDIETIEFLRSIVSQENPLETHYVCTVPQDTVSVHTKIFPFKDRLKILRTLPFELEEDTPFNPEETLFDGRIIRYKQAQSEVLACACPKETVKKYLQLLRDSGISPQLLTPEGFALANHFEKWAEPIPTATSSFDPSETDETLPPRHCHAVLSLGHSRTLLLILDGSNLVDIRSISWGGENIAKAIQAKYNIAYTEALKQLQGNSFILTNQEGATPDQIFFSNVITDSVKELIRELRLILMEIQASANVVITGVSLTGGVSRLQNIGAFLTQGLELPVNKFSLLNQYPNTNFERTPHSEAVSGVATGIALEGFRKPRNPAVSFLRGEFVVQSNALKNFLDTWGTTLRFAALAVVIFYLYANLRESMALSMAEEADTVMRDQAQSVARLKGGKASEEGIEKFVNQKRKTIKQLKDVESFTQMNSALDILKKINEAVPGRATLRLEVRKMAIRDSTVRMQGYTSTLSDVQMLKQALSNLAKNQKINDLQNDLNLPPGKVAFGFQFEVDRNIRSPKKSEPNGSVNE